jgi:hypothetical protein
VDKFRKRKKNKFYFKWRINVYLNLTVELVQSLCSKCRVIIKTGKGFTENEWKSFRGELNLEAQFCDKCKAKQRNEKIDQILKIEVKGH